MFNLSCNKENLFKNRQRYKVGLENWALIIQNDNHI